MTDLAFNPRFANYARAHGRTAAEQLEHDRAAWPGGSMCGFVLWNNAKIAEATTVIPNAFVVGGALVDHAAYDAWLTTEVDRMLDEEAWEADRQSELSARPGI